MHLAQGLPNTRVPIAAVRKPTNTCEVTLLLDGLELRSSTGEAERAKPTPFVYLRWKQADRFAARLVSLIVAHPSTAALRPLTANSDTQALGTALTSSHPKLGRLTWAMTRRASLWYWASGWGLACPNPICD